MDSLRSSLRVFLRMTLLNSVVQHSIFRPTSTPSYMFAEGEDSTKGILPTRLSNVNDRPQVKGEERNVNKPSDELSRELTKKANLRNARTVKNGNARKQRTNTSKKTRRNGVKRINSHTKQKKNRGATSRGQNRTNGKRATGKKTTTRRRGRNSHRMKKTLKKTRYGSSTGSTTITKNQNTQGTKNIQNQIKRPSNPSIVTGGALFYPNFEMMTCLADGMAPSYLPPMYFSSSKEDCCMTHFAGMVAECILHSSSSVSGGGYFVTVQSSGKSGKSGGGWGGSSVIGGGSWMDSIGKAGKSKGKSGKSLTWVGVPWGGYSAYPTYYPSYTPTNLPTTYIPTYYPTELPTEQENIATEAPTTYSPTPLGSASIPTYYPTSLIPTLNPTLSSTDAPKDDDKHSKNDDDQETEKDDGGKGKSLYKGSGDGTYYYDVTGKFCSQDSGPYAENDGYPTCTSFDTKLWKTLQEYNTNNIVAIDRTLLSTEEGREKYCGKEIKVYKDGKEMKGTFVVFDGCEACEGGGRIDFSLSALDDINNGEACNDGVVPGISWDVVDNQIIEFVP
ncbi:hypothetical protein HJC23_012635 [Cyclotella cryptica]|uniref:Uncharacterized protein n=1 Tax=Cyclotella cryptica TaxID=29204 RepID=A0ABD3QLH2_9STRA|eukprot:CCRYP_004168-RA/>CCRYP_004168-RA protein AED:0.00 eAED:0.00 QI:259/1/1/1/1/1/2/1214/559